MRVTFRHGEKHGILGTHYYLSLTVDLTPTERAIIKRRELVDLTVVEGARKPIATRSQIEFVKAGRVLFPLLVVGAFLSQFFWLLPSPISFVPGAPYWLLAFFVALVIASYVLPHLLQISTTPSPVFVEEVLHKPTFRLYAASPYHCKIMIPEIHEQLTRLKLVVEGSADLGLEETFEF